MHRRFGESRSVDLEIVERRQVCFTGYTLIILLQQINLKVRKKDKERLTIVIYCNEDDFEKIPLWCIGKYAKPRCFQKCEYGQFKLLVSCQQTSMDDWGFILRICLTT